MSAWRLLPIAFIVVPIIEISVIVQVGQLIGIVPTVVLLLMESALGAWLVKREGTRAWQALSQAVRTGHLPGRELTDAALVLVGGTLLLTPGFVTDVLGFALVLPPTRPVPRRLLQAYVAKRAVATASRPSENGVRGGAFEGGAGEWSGHRGPSGRVVPGEVIDPDDRPAP